MPSTPVPPPSLEELLTPPPAAAIKSLKLPRGLPGQDDNLRRLGEQFDSPDLKLAVKEGREETRGLNEVEKMFLVSRLAVRWFSYLSGSCIRSIGCCLFSTAPADLCGAGAWGARVLFSEPSRHIS